MPGVKARGERVRQFILDRVPTHPSDIASLTAAHFKISRQAVNKHLARMVAEGALIPSGSTRARRYRLAAIFEWRGTFTIASSPEEDLLWSQEISRRLGDLPSNARAIWQYGFSEMYNNVLDHSEGTEAFVTIHRTPGETEVVVHDDGIGIFRKIQAALGLVDERHAVLELAKGKLTTDAANHSGEGIFFTSRVFDSFAILSGDTYFSHDASEEHDWIVQSERPRGGTAVWMKLSNHTSRTTQQVFSRFASSDDDYRFTKTIVPVRMAQYGDDLLVSRSQAKRLLARVDRFETVVFDFTAVESIGQAFADEVFRVFANSHSDMALTHLHANPQVEKMIRRAQALD